MKMSKLEILANFGFEDDPFGMLMETSDMKRVKSIVNLAIKSKAMVSIVGERGIGKTIAVRKALKDRENIQLVKPITPDVERLRIGDIETAIILDLSNENVKRNKEIRIRQLRRVLGEASRKSRVVIILEEAHRIHGNTLRALKTLRELEWIGRSPLFAVIFVGQANPLMKRGVDEVRLRAHSVYMKGLSSSEVIEYINLTVGNVFEEDGITALSRMCQGKSFLDIQEMIFEVMECAIVNGSEKVSSIEVFEKFGGGLKEVMKKTGISTGDIAKEVGMSKSTVSLVVNEKQGTLTEDKYNQTRTAIANVLRKKISKSGTSEVNYQIKSA